MIITIDTLNRGGDLSPLLNITCKSGSKSVQKNISLDTISGILLYGYDGHKDDVDVIVEVIKQCLREIK